MLALTGDSLITRRLSVHDEPAFLRMIELVRGADAAFTNLEMLFHDYEPFPMTESGGTWLRAEPALTKELAWAGFDMVSRANNHAGDYGVLGMRLTTRHVAEAGLVQAGVGDSLAEAREAKFLETARGRVALVSVASTFPDSSRAGKTRGDVPPRPGLNPLRFTTTYRVPRARLETLRELARELGLNPAAEGDELAVFRSRFRAAEKADVETEPNPEDVAEIAAVVRNASRLADYTVLSIHAHEGDRDVFVPARFLVSFAHAMIDAGADVFVGHGPHVLRGIEIYKGKPILYSLGNFIFENETVLRLPYESYEPYGLGADQHVADFNDRRYDNDRRGFPSRREMWESVIALPRWQGRALVELRLVPITLGFGRPRQVRGRPLLADADLARKIIDDLARLSAPFGTRIEFRDGTGLVRLTAP
jgi:poly-gamma-glutamate synthesis protein (capsule biosynthesis protein)